MKTAALLFVTVLAVSCGGTGDAPPKSGLTVVPHETLLGLLPTIQGWTRNTPRGETDITEGVARVQANYDQQGGMGRVSVEIVDTTGNANMFGPLNEFITANRETTSGDPAMPTITSPVSVLTFPGQQEWTSGVNNGALALLVASRFTIAITGRSISGPEVMRGAAEAIDLKKLASLK